MRQYEFLTTWHIDVPVADVWKVIHDIDTWPQWWKGVVGVEKLRDGDEAGIGSLHRTTWKSALPYKLVFDSEVVRIEHEQCIEARAFGELDGVGVWQFTAKGTAATDVVYDWRVTTTKSWMNLLYPVAKPFFRWNHDVIMGWGEQGLKNRLSAGSQ